MAKRVESRPDHRPFDRLIYGKLSAVQVAGFVFVAAMVLSALWIGIAIDWTALGSGATFFRRFVWTFGGWFVIFGILAIFLLVLRAATGQTPKGGGSPRL